MEYTNVILLLIFNGDRIIASHFRGGMMNVEPLDGQDLVQVTYRFSWQQSYAAEYFCNASTVAESKAINVEGMLSTVGGCADMTFTPINLRCTAYSEVDDWMSGTNSLQFECNASFVDLRYSGRSWLSVQNGGSAWSLYLSTTLTMRSDTNKVNTSPVSVMQPIQQLLYGCQQNISIPAVDNDGDIIRCRWSTSGVIDECGGICSKMPGLTLNEGTCVLIYSPNIAPLGTYAVAVQVEDFINSNATIPMSSIPVQFLIEIAGYSTTCDKIPKVTDSNLSADNVIEIPTGSVFEDRIVAIGGNNNDRIGAIDTIGPEGMSKGALQLDQHDPTEHKWFVDVTWLPTDDQKGKHLFCFRAVNIAMVASPQTCKELLAGATTSTSSNPSENTIDDGQSTGTIKDGIATSASSKSSENTMNDEQSTGTIIDGTATSASSKSSEITMDNELSTGTTIGTTTTDISSNPSKNTIADGISTGVITDETATSASSKSSENTMDDELSTGTTIGNQIMASHFLGGIMTLEPHEENDLVKMNYRFSWQQSYGKDYFCNASTVASSKTINVEGTLRTVGGCSNVNFTPILLKCTDYSSVDDWMSGTHSSEFECSASFVGLRFSGRQWLSEVNGGGNWSLYLNASLTKRSDTNKVNRTPISVMQPIQRILYRCHQNITIPVVDNDGDMIRCRWSTPTEIDECGGICGKMLGLTLHEDTCVLSYSPNIAPLGTYAVAVQVEDFISSTAGRPMSSIPVQFLIEVDDFLTACDHIPKVTDSSLSHVKVIEVPIGSAFEDRVVAEAEDDNTRIEAIDIIGPDGMNKSALQQDNDDPTGHTWFVDVFWIPADGQEGKHLFCYMAINNIKVASPQTCKELLAGSKTTTSASPDSSNNDEDTLSNEAIIGITSCVLTFISIIVVIYSKRKGILCMRGSTPN